MRIILFICSIFSVLITLGCTCKNSSTSLPKVNASYLNDSIKEDKQSIILQLMNNDTISLPVGKVDVVMINNTDSVYITGTYYRIERFEDKFWIEIPRKFGSFEDIGYVIKPNGGRKIFTINLQNVRHVYQKGMYRICKKVSKGENQYYIYCTFYVR